jgi:hypothetical protein
MENFDSAGGFRKTENGAPIDASGEIDGVTFKDGNGLSQAIRDNPATPSCLVNRVYAFAVGRAPAKGEIPFVKSLEANFAKDGYRLPDLLRRIATSRAFYRVSPPQTGALTAPELRPTESQPRSER